VQLIKKIASTPSFSLFEFRRLSAVKADPSESTADAVSSAGSSFDNLWENL